MEKYLKESSETDLNKQKIASSIYDKIVKNINIIQFKQIENQTVNTNRGVMSITGVVFNLNQLDKRFDLDVMFCNQLKKSNTIGFFDDKSNRMVFFILNDYTDTFENNIRLTRLRFELWIEKNYFIHEFIHFLDSKQYSPTYTSKNPNSDAEYYNSNEEFNAYFHEILYFALKNKKLFTLDFKSFINKVITSKSDYEQYMTNENKRKLIKRLYKIYEQKKKI